MTHAPRSLLVVLSLALVAPLALAGHTPPSLDKVDGGDVRCEGKEGAIRGSGVAQDSTLPILRTTDNGHLIIYADASSSIPREMKCLFEVKITGHSLFGVNPQGGLNAVTSTPCSLSGAATCTAWAEADWWVTFVDPVNGIFTSEIDVHFDLLVNGAVVDSGTVRIVEPSVPGLPALALP